MNAQSTRKIGRRDFVAMREALEDCSDLKALRRAKTDPKNRRGRPFQEAARDLGLIK